MTDISRFIGLLEEYPAINYNVMLIEYLIKEHSGNFPKSRDKQVRAIIKSVYPKIDQNFLNQLKFIKQTCIRDNGVKLTRINFKTVLLIDNISWLVIIKFILPLDNLELINIFGIEAYVFQRNGAGIPYEMRPSLTSFINFFTEQGLLGKDYYFDINPIYFQYIPANKHNEYQVDKESGQERAYLLIRFLRQNPGFKYQTELIQSLIQYFELTESERLDENKYARAVKQKLLDMYQIDPTILDHMSFLFRYQHPNSSTVGLLFRADFKILDEYYQTLIHFDEGGSYICKNAVDIFHNDGTPFEPTEEITAFFIEPKLISYLIAHGMPISENCITTYQDNNIDQVIEQYRDLEVYVR